MKEGGIQFYNIHSVRSLNRAQCFGGHFSSKRPIKLQFSNAALTFIVRKRGIAGMRGVRRSSREAGKCRVARATSRVDSTYVCKWADRARRSNDATVQ